MRATSRQPQWAPDGAPVHYERERRRPEQTTLYCLVRQHASSFIAHTEASTAAALPRFIKDEFDGFLDAASWPAASCGCAAASAVTTSCWRSVASSLDVRDQRATWRAGRAGGEPVHDEQLRFRRRGAPVPREHLRRQRRWPGLRPHQRRADPHDQLAPHGPRGAGVPLPCPAGELRDAARQRRRRARAASLASSAPTAASRPRVISARSRWRRATCL